MPYKPDPNEIDVSQAIVQMMTETAIGLHQAAQVEVDLWQQSPPLLRALQPPKKTTKQHVSIKFNVFMQNTPSLLMLFLHRDKSKGEGMEWLVELDMEPMNAVEVQYLQPLTEAKVALDEAKARGAPDLYALYAPGPIEKQIQALLRIWKKDEVPPIGSLWLEDNWSGPIQAALKAINKNPLIQRFRAWRDVRKSGYDMLKDLEDLVL